MTQYTSCFRHEFPRARLFSLQASILSACNSLPCNSLQGAANEIMWLQSNQNWNLDNEHFWIGQIKFLGTSTPDRLLRIEPTRFDASCAIKPALDHFPPQGSSKHEQPMEQADLQRLCDRQRCPRISM
jgi:hypothetical protein